MSLPVLLITFRGNMGKEHLSHTHKNRGKMHCYLGMTLDYTIDGKVQVKIDDY